LREALSHNEAQENRVLSKVEPVEADSYGEAYLEQEKGANPPNKPVGPMASKLEELASRLKFQSFCFGLVFRIEKGGSWCCLLPNLGLKLPRA
jgi:hypothetical protein